MSRTTLLSTLAALAVVSLVACGGSPGAATPSATSVSSEPLTVPSGDISTLLFPAEVSSMAGVDQLTTSYRDQKSAAASVDPGQVAHMDSFDSLSFDTADGARSLVLTTIDFDSEDAAADHFDLMVDENSSMLELAETVGDASAYMEASGGGVASLIVFKKS